MENLDYKVNPKLIPPVILAMLSGMGLIIISIIKNHNFLFFIVLTPFLYLGLEILSRKIILNTQGLTIHKLFRSKHLDWSEIVNVDSMRTGSKIFLILQTSKTRPVIITNTIASFPDLANKIIQSVPSDKVAEAVKEISRGTPQKLWPLVQAWLIFAIFFSVMIGKLLE